MANLLKRIEGEPYPGIFTVYCEDDVEDLSKYGQGPTLEEARADWGEKLVERVDDHIFDSKVAGEIDWFTANDVFNALDELTWLPY